MKPSLSPDNCDKSTENGNPDYELVSFWWNLVYRPTTVINEE